MAFNFHDNAAALILAADDKVPNPSFGCPACELLSALTDAFDGHVEDDSLADDTVGQFHGPSWEGFRRYTEEELRPYFTIPFEMHVETRPPRFSDKLFDTDFAKAEIEAARVEFRKKIEANRGSASPA